MPQILLYEWMMNSFGVSFTYPFSKSPLAIMHTLSDGNYHYNSPCSQLAWCSNTRKYDSAVHFCHLIPSFEESPVQITKNTVLPGSIMAIFTENSLLQKQHLTFFYQHVNNSLRAQLIFFSPLRRFSTSFYL